MCICMRIYMYIDSFLANLVVVDAKCGYVGRHEECLAQQESGAVLLKSSMIPGGILYKVCIN